jgi:cell division protein FtsI/penicillin-binding protein 2
MSQRSVRGSARQETPTESTGMPVRLALMCALFAGCVLVLLWRLYSFQIRDTERYHRLANEERRAQIPIIPRRGALLDTNGNPLAVSVLYDSVYALGPLVGDPENTAAVLSPVLELPQHEIRAKLDKENNRPVVLKSRVASAVSERVRSLELPGVYLEHEPIRRYPEGSLAEQILGFVGQDFKGLGGLELSYEDELAGTPGVIDTEKDTAGQEITLGRRVLTPPREGADLVLTLDRYVQRTAERLLDEAVKKNKARGGLIMVMEPSTGRILAAATNPTYSLTDDVIYRPEQGALYKSTIVTDQYEPGSTMKLVTMSSAIEEGLVNPSTTINDTGLAFVDGVAIHNWDGAANGQITMTQVLIKSSNVGTQWVSGLLGADRFYHYLDSFGFGKRTGIRLPGEVQGTVRTNQTENWTRVDLATNSYGQGVAVTPLQMLSAIASLAHDGVLMKPQFVREVRGPDGTQVIEPEMVGQTVSPKTARTVIQMMEEVAQQESLRQHRIPGFRVALKTGTADTPTNLGYNLDLTFASVVSLLPADDPRFAVLIRLDGPEALYGGVVAAPVLKQLGQELFTYYRIPPSDPVAAASATT